MVTESRTELRAEAPGAERAAQDHEAQEQLETDISTQGSGRSSAHQGLCLIRSFYIWVMLSHALNLKTERAETKPLSVWLKSRTAGQTAPAPVLLQGKGWERRNGCWSCPSGSQGPKFPGRWRKGQTHLCRKKNIKHALLSFFLKLSSTLFFLSQL